MQCFLCLRGCSTPRWTDLYVYGQDVRGLALVCDRCGYLSLTETMAASACAKALAKEPTHYLVLDSRGLSLEAAVREESSDA